MVGRPDRHGEGPFKVRETSYPLPEVLVTVGNRTPRGQGRGLGSGAGTVSRVNRRSTDLVVPLGRRFLPGPSPFLSADSEGGEGVRVKPHPVEESLFESLESLSPGTR